MGIFDFFRKRNNSDENTIEETIEIKEINEESLFLRSDLQKEKKYFIDVKESQDVLERNVMNDIYIILKGKQDFDTIYNEISKINGNISTKDIEVLNKFINDGLDKPEYFKKIYPTKESWNNAVTNVVLIMIYSLRGLGVDSLLKIAMDPTKEGLKSINLLCKLAANNIEVQKIVDSIIYIMKDFDEITISEILKFLSQIKGNVKVNKIIDAYFKKYIKENNIETAYDCVLNKINLSGKFSREDLIFLKAMALSEEMININLFIVGESGNVDFSKLESELRVKAAITFYSLHNKDEEINNMLKYIKETSDDENLKDYLKELL